jgi:hypothetical protein
MIWSGLRKLENKGTMVIWWGGLPFHAVLVFLTRYLRAVFERVHVLAMPASDTMEVVVVCAVFKRESVKDKPGKPRVPMGSFLHSAFRDEDLDDSLLWALTQKEAVEEVLGVVADKSSKGYSALWTLFSKKYAHLMSSVSSGAAKKVLRKKAEPKREEKKNKEADKEQYAAAGGAQASTVKPTGKSAGDPVEEAGKASPPKPKKSDPNKLSLSELRGKCAIKNLATSGTRAELIQRLEDYAASRANLSTESFRSDGSPVLGKIYPRTASSPCLRSTMSTVSRWSWNQSTESWSPEPVKCYRSQPWLSCTLGGCPGGTGHSHTSTGPNPLALAEKFPVLRQAITRSRDLQERLKVDPLTWPKAVANEKADSLRLAHRPQLEPRLSRVQSHATSLSFRESAGMDFRDTYFP